MYIKRSILVLVAALAAAPAAAENWRASSKTGDAAAYIDTDSIRRTGDRVTFVRELRFEAPRPLGENLKFDRLQALYDGDCKAMTLQSIELRAKLADTIVLSAAERGKVDSAKPGSTAETDLKAACFDQWPAR